VPADNRGPTLRSLILPIYVPTLLLATGTGAMGTFLPLFLVGLGESVGRAALLVGIGTAGILIFDLPSGFIVARYGERRTLTASTAAMILAAVLISLSPTAGVATLGLFFVNAASSFWMLGRLEFIRGALPVGLRGRGLATVGGVMRTGLLLGPLAGGFAARAVGYRPVFAGTAVLAAVSLVLFALSSRRPVASPGPAAGGPRTATLWDGKALRRVLAGRGRVLATAGVSMLILCMVRAGRSLVLPLWGQGIGLDAAGVGLAVGLSSAVDTLFFYPAGVVSDHLGRRWSAVGCLLVLSAGMALVPLTHTLGPFLLAGVVIGVGNGLGSGINMTLGADFASGSEPGVFLGLWRLVSDLGLAAAPLAIGVVAELLALGPATLLIAGLGVLGGVYHAALVPETLVRQRPGRSPEGGT
jgi:MFS family permease